MNDRPLIAYAYLAQCAGQNRNVASGLVPLVKPLIKNKAGEPFNPKILSTNLSEFYGIKIHPWAVENMAEQLETAGLLIRASKTTNFHEYYYSEVQGETDCLDEDAVREIADAFVDFSREILSFYQRDIDEDCLKRDFLNELTNLDFIASILKPERAEKEDIGQNTLRLKAKATAIECEIYENKITTSTEIEILCASFILYAFKNNTELYERIYKITTGALIAELILNYQNPETGIKFYGLTIYVDAPFILSILGLKPKDSMAYAKELCDQLRQNGATIAVFPHTIDEVSEIIRTTASSYERGEAYGSIADQMRNPVFNNYFSTLVPSENLQSAINRHGLKTFDPHIPEANYGYFTEDDENKLISSIGFYKNTHAQSRDASSISKVIRLRKGKSVLYRDFHKCGFVFLTENARLANMASDFVTSHNIISEKCVPPCITDRYLAGLLWVLFGGEGNQLSRYRLLANCTSAVHPRVDVVERMHSFLIGVDENKAEQFKALMTTERAAQFLITQTLGNSDLITEHNFEELYDKVALTTAEEVTKQKNQEILELKNAHAAEINQITQNTEASIDGVKEQFSSMLEILNIKILELENKQHTSEDEALATKIKLKRMEDENTLRKNENEKIIRSVVKKCKIADQLTRKRTRVKIISIYFIVLLITNILAIYLPKQFGKDEILAYVLSPYILIAFNSILTMVGVWIVPDYLFGAYVTRRGKKAIEDELKALDGSPLLNKYDVNWVTGDIKPVDSV